MMKKFLLTLGIAAAAICSFSGMSTVSAAENSSDNNTEITETAELSSTNINNPDVITVSYGSTLAKAEANCVPYVKSYSWDSDYGEDPAPVDYAKFTLTQKSYVKISANHTTTKSYTFPYGKSTVNLYSNKGYSVLLGDTSFDNTESWVSPSIYLELDAGTYYLSLNVKSNYGFSYDFTGYVNVAAVKATKGVTVKKTINSTKNAATLKVSTSGIGEVTSISYLEGKKTASSSWSGATKLKSNKVKLKKNGWVTFQIQTEYYTTYKQYKVTGIDTTKPTVKGVKNKKSYKKPVTIKFSDKSSGIKKATLNGKKIKSGKKVKKAGSYTLKVWDKAGNCRIVKFKIKK